MKKDSEKTILTIRIILILSAVTVLAVTGIFIAGGRKNDDVRQPEVNISGTEEYSESANGINNEKSLETVPEIKEDGKPSETILKNKEDESPSETIPENDKDKASGTETEQEESSAQNQAEDVLPEQEETLAIQDEKEPDMYEKAPMNNGYVIVIDPGHQAKGDSTQEPNGPGSSTMKARVTGGTSGRFTGVMEYELNLDISLKLRDALEALGYTVYMTRETHDVNISNMERAQYASSVGADIAVRIHANGVDNSSVSGALALAPSSANPYIANLSSESQTLGKCILDAYCAETGMRNQGVVSSDTMTGINWSTVPVTILEMGYMTNPDDDVNMENEDYKQKMVQGIVNGIENYFALNP